ncbi:MAG: archease [Anaerolineales bacterium]
MPFEEIAHTADWSLRVWAGNLETLFAEAGRGLYALAGARPAEGRRSRRRFEAAAPDPEALLVAFLSELVYALEQEGTIYENFQIEIEANRLRVEMDGAPLEAVNKIIKAVTYHNLQIRCSERGCEVEIVFDV